MKKTSVSSIILSLLLCVILILSAFLYMRGHFNRNNEETYSSYSEVSEPDEIDTSSEIIISEEPVSESEDENGDMGETEEPDTTGEWSPSALGDNSTGGVSVFDTPFSDGYEFPNLSEFDFVFIGDSIFDMNGSAISVPRQLEVYTEARVYNLSKNTSCAGDLSNGYISFPRLTENFVAGTQSGEVTNYTFNSEILRFNEDDHSGRKMVIVMNACINDYIFSTPISNADDRYDICSYEGALRTSISQIKKAYPKATLVYMTPYYIGVKEQGEEINSYGYKLTDYISSLRSVAAEYQIMCFDLRSYDAFSQFRPGPLTDDLIHPSAMGSKTIDRLFCDFVINNIR